MSGGTVEIVTKVSPRSMEDTIARLSAIVADRGLTLFAVIDHSGAANDVGLELRDTKVVIFGSPVAGTPVMEAAPLAALDLPLKVLVWTNGAQTNVSYTSTDELASRYGLTESGCVADGDLERRAAASSVAAVPTGTTAPCVLASHPPRPSPRRALSAKTS